MSNLNEQLGVPDIKVAGLSIWVHQRQFPDAEEFWDANWLVVTAVCEAPGARVMTSGPIIHLTEIVGLLKESQQIYATLSGQASLNCMEPELDMTVAMGTGGRLTVEVRITPNQLAQKHWFEFESDQSCLPELMRDCRNVLKKFPLLHQQNH